MTSVEADENMARNDYSPRNTREKTKLITEEISVFLFFGRYGKELADLLRVRCRY